MAMVGLLNVYLNTDQKFSWIDASVLISKSQGRGLTHARNLRQWSLAYLRSRQLPLHQYGQAHWTILTNKDIAEILQSKVMEIAKKGYLKASDIVDIVAGPNVQAMLSNIGICKPMITEQMARNWLQMLEWRYTQTWNGLYVDGHERDDIVQYQKVFIAWWKEYEK
jgi:hypothetical protein